MSKIGQLFSKITVIGAGADLSTFKKLTNLGTTFLLAYMRNDPYSIFDFKKDLEGNLLNYIYCIQPLRRFFSGYYSFRIFPVVNFTFAA